MITRNLSRKRLTVCLFSVLAVAGVTGTVVAGQKSESNVSITVGASSSTASGSLGTARASADSNQMISCTISGFTTSNNVSCSARDAAGNTLSCTANSNADYLAAAVSGIGPNSRIYFVVNSSGVCTQINSTNGSHYKPVVP